MGSAAGGGRRIAVVGTTGSGKTVFAARAARILGCPHVELDALHWEPGWTPADREAFRMRVRLAVAAPSWVADGNYAAVRDLVWAAADTLFWLDYPLGLVLARLLRRTWRRSISGEKLWNGNRENPWHALSSRDSLLLWALSSHPRHRREFPRLLAQPQYAHLEVRRLRTPRRAEDWLAALRGGPPA